MKRHFFSPPPPRTPISRCITPSIQSLLAVFATSARLFPGTVVVLCDTDVGEIDVEVSEEILGVLVDLNAVLLNEGDVWNVIQFLLALLLLKFERNSTDWSSLDATHQVCQKSGNLVAHALGWNHSNLINDTLVDGEVKGQAVVVLFDDFACRALDSFGADASPAKDKNNMVINKIKQSCAKKSSRKETCETTGDSRLNG